MDDLKLREVYRGLAKIEETFKVTKSCFESRPVYVKEKEHIEAHFLICFVSLVILRLLEKKLNNKYTASQIIESLKKCVCSHLTGNTYQLFYRDEIIIELEQIFNVNLGQKFMSIQEIKKILKNNKMKN